MQHTQQQVVDNDNLLSIYCCDINNEPLNY
jgi:hypothetical protein